MRQAVRFWLRHRAPASWLVASLGLAVGLATAVVAVAHATLWRQLPVRAPHELMRVYVEGRRGDGRIAPEEYPIWKVRQDALTSIASYQNDDALFLDTGSRVERFDAIHVTTNLFDVLGVTPVLGRLFSATDTPAGPPEVAIISERLWRTTFHADPMIIGRRVPFTVWSAVQTATIVGVVPDGFDMQTFFGDGVDVYRPITDGVAGEGFGTYRYNDRLVIGRLAPGRDHAAAEARLWLLAREAASELKLRSQPTAVRLVPLHEELYARNRPFVVLLLLAGGLAVLVAIANGSGVVMALAAKGAREESIRRALGASSWQLRAQAILRSAVVGVGAAVISLLVARATVSVLIAFAPSDIRRMDSTALGWFESLCAVGLAAMCASLITAAPIVQRQPRVLSTALKSTGTMTSAALRLRRALLAAQTAVVLALLACAALAVSTYWQLSGQPLGFSDENVLVAEFWVPRRYSGDAARVQTLVEDLRRTARAAPGQRQVAAAFDLPLTKRFGWKGVTLADGRRLSVVDNDVTDGVFDVLGVPILAGRDFAASPAGVGEQVIVNQEFADRYLGGIRRAVGQMIALTGSTQPWEVIGVVGNVREQSLTSSLDPVLYSSLSRMSPSRLHLLTREREANGRAIADLTAAFRQVDPELSVSISPLIDRRRHEMAAATLQATLIGSLALFTLVLAGMGIYALVGQLGTDRARELSIRTALGASPASLIRLLMRVALTSTAAGIGCGLLLTWFSVRILRQFLFQTDAFDLRLWGLAVSVIGSAAILAAWLPARRAAARDPVTALKQE